ncbi:hypothetical protein QTQ03_08520 [Micromonospora sp. WMMA1363]|uniref:hypothetical protein n=1 Tax=Micromonospora sp. WMMA1363 TaxID=3053985 RepID=UPI00259D1C77|nr:hypothetical protein [Micromonospora sp. WMMA1363]MDM4719626.1 hypothetical protein [Micromonospora sp. WMMA1363]
MTYYKFLARGGVGPFSGQSWSSDWLVVPDVVPCVRGLHACRVSDLPYWMHDELWRVELDGPVTEVGRKVVAPRGRLSTRVEAWDVAAAEAFVRACVARVAGHAADECGELDDGSLREVARHLTDSSGGAAPLAGVRDLALSRQGAAAGAGRSIAARVCGLLVDAVDMAGGYPVVALGYVAARAAQTRPLGAGGDRHDAERRWQVGWLTERLELV